MGVSGLAPDVPPEVVEDAELWRGLVRGSIFSEGVCGVFLGMVLGVVVLV